MPKNSKNKTTKPCCGLHSDSLTELMSLLQELNERLLFCEEVALEMQQLSKSYQTTYEPTEEFLENFAIPLSEELWEELCKALGSDKIIFMAIA